MKIVNIGVSPPPYGGISIHLKRFKEYLDARGIENELIDTSRIEERKKAALGIRTFSFKRAFFYLLLSRKCIIHFHDYGIFRLFLFYLLSLKHCVVISFHNERFLPIFKSSGKLVYFMVKIILNRIDYIIVDNKKSMEVFRKNVGRRNNISLIPEFIPPSTIPQLDETSISTLRKNCDFILSSNAFQISFFDNEDLYGIDLLVELIKELNSLNVGMVFLLPNIGDYQYFEALKKKINLYGIKDKFLFVTDPIEEASSLWALSDIVIRATNTDGNALTILEALTLGVPVIASDCTDRPEGVVLFQSRNKQDLIEKTKTVLMNLEHYREKLLDYYQVDNAEKLLCLYQHFMK